MADRAWTLPRGVADCLLSLTFLGVVFLCACTTLLAFLNYHYAFDSFETILRDTEVAVARLCNRGAPAASTDTVPVSRHMSADDLHDTIREHVALLRSQERHLLDSNTITYLFQMLLLAVVSAAAFLFNRAMRSVRRGEEQVEVAERAVENAERAAAMMEPRLRALAWFVTTRSFLDSALRYTQATRRYKHEDRSPFYVQIRDDLRAATAQLSVGIREHVLLDQELINQFLVGAARSLRHTLSADKATPRDLVDQSKKAEDLSRHIASAQNRGGE